MNKIFELARKYDIDSFEVVLVVIGGVCLLACVADYYLQLFLSQI